MVQDLNVLESGHREIIDIVDSHLLRRDSELGQMLIACVKLSNQTPSEKQAQWLTL